MPKPQFILENETHNILRDFEIKAGYSTMTRRPYLVLINNKIITRHLADFTILADRRMKMKENEKINNARILVESIKDCEI